MPSSPASEQTTRPARPKRPRSAEELQRPSRRARRPLQAGACRPRQLPQARRTRLPSAASPTRGTGCSATGWRRSTASSGARMTSERRRARRAAGRTRADAIDPRPPRRAAVRRCRRARSIPSGTRPSRRARATTSPTATVLDVARSGYAVGDRVLRPAQVVVSRRPGRGALMAVAFRDYYEVLGVPRDASTEDDPPRVPQAGARVPPGRQQGSGAPRTASRRSPRRYEVLRDREARSATTGCGPNWRAGQDVSGARGLRRCAGRSGFRGRAASSSATSDFSDFFESMFGADARARRRGGFERLRSARQRPRGRPRAVARGGRGRRAAQGLAAATAATTRSTFPPASATASASGWPGEGGAGLGRGPAGDLFLRVRLKPHPRFQRRRPRHSHRRSQSRPGRRRWEPRSRCRR